MWFSRPQVTWPTWAAVVLLLSFAPLLMRTAPHSSTQAQGLSQLPTNVSFNLTETDPGQLLGIPEGQAPSGPITVKDARFQGTVTGDLVGIMELTVTVVMQGPGYTSGSDSGTLVITAGAGQGTLTGIASGNVQSTLVGWPPTEVRWTASGITATAQDGTGIFARTSGSGAYSASGVYFPPPVQIPTPPSGTPPSGGGQGYALRRSFTATGSVTGTVVLDLQGWDTPLLDSPPADTALQGLGTTLEWRLPQGSTQYQIQVNPANNDGPAINLIRNAERTFTIQPPVMGQGNYVMLPGMSYSWRVRATSKATFAPESDPSWSPWSGWRAFRTQAPSSAPISVVSPASGVIVGSGSQVLQWANTATDIFYYEIQASPDPNFGEQGAVAAVWHNLVHGGVTVPVNSWATPTVQPGTTYYWRVRPRVQGDGTPVAWSATWSFRTQ